MKIKYKELIDKIRQLNKKKCFLIVFVTTLSLIGAKYLFHLSFVRLPSIEEQAFGITILDRSNQKIAVIQEEGERQPITLSKVSKNMINALVAVEDRTFFKHLGVDPSGIARATFTNIKEQELVEGGSTLTQQLMKTMYFEYNDRSLRRKILELVMALDVEAGYSKDKILETYLNQVYFGRGAYGIERAAKIYFNKHASDLSLAESAFIAGLVKAPSSYGNATHAKLAKDRQKQVIKDMVECGFITDAEAREASLTKLNFAKQANSQKYPYYISQVISILKEELGEETIWRKPITVYSNMDLEAQKFAEAQIANSIKQPKLKSTEGRLDQGALISIAIEDGAVLSVVGGAGSFEQNQWNRALNPHTAGSTFKPFVYLAALGTNTIGPGTVLNDEPITIPDPESDKPYKPENYDKQFLGPITVRDALRLSRNVCAVKVAVDTGLEKVADYAHKAGITSEIKLYPSMALGTAAVSPLEIANAYATIARGGEYIEPRFIRSVIDENEKPLKVFEQKRKQVLPKEPCLQVLDGMIDVVKSGTGHRAYLPGIQVAGKTGTADDRKDIWFVGMTPEIVTAVWAGNDKNQAIKSSSVAGGTVTAKIWARYMTNYYKKNAKPQTSFKKPKNPLSDSLPFYVTIPKSINDAVDEFSESLKQAASTLESGKGIINQVTKELKKLF